MIGVFSRFIAPDDKSIEYLSQIFGSMNGVIENPNGSGFGVSSINMLSVMFSSFNTIMLGVGALIVIYVTILGVIYTAHEGEFMGKKWHSLWMPIRMVLGIACLVPTPAGYSGLQMIMMWVIIQGIGAADFIWSTALTAKDKLGSPYALSASVPGGNINSTMAGLFQAITCEQTSRLKYAPVSVREKDQRAYYCNENPTASFCQATELPNINPNDTTTSTIGFGPSSACGVLTYCNQSTQCKPVDAAAEERARRTHREVTTGPDSLSCDACKLQVRTLAQLIPFMRDIASQFAEADYTYQRYIAVGLVNDALISMLASLQAAGGGAGGAGSMTMQNRMPDFVQEYCDVKDGGCSPLAKDMPAPGTNEPNIPLQTVKEIFKPYVVQPLIGDNKDFIKVASGLYTNAMEAVLAQYMARLAQNPDNIKDTNLQAAQRTGWIFAGAYYYTIATVTKGNLQAVMPDISFNGQDPSTTIDDAHNPLKPYRTNYSAARAIIYSLSNGAPAGTEDFSQLSDSTSAALNESFESNLQSEGSDKLAVMMTTGTIFINIAVVLYIAIIYIMVTIGIAGNISIFVFGTGFINPVGPWATLLSMWLIPALMGLIGILLSVGATFSIYIPLIPYVIFTIGAIGWMMSTIEAMVAGPLVALGILSPSGEHELLGKSAGALMLLFNIFMRPTLMIFGMVAAILLVNVVLTMINYAFWTTVMSSIQGTYGFGIIFYIAAYVSLIVTAMNKCFSAIHVIPEKVMRWIGGQGEQYGEDTAVGDMKSAVSGAASSTKGAMDSGKATVDKAGETAKGNKDKQEIMASNKNNGGDGGGKAAG